MPPALAKGKLSLVVPTPKELAEAKAHLRALAPQQLHSKTVSMAAFLKKNSDPDSMHKDKNVVLELFHVHVMRCKSSEKKWSSEREVTTKRTLASTLSWYSEEKLLHPSIVGHVSLIPFFLLVPAKLTMCAAYRTRQAHRPTS